jgi:hypothetical protein
MTRRHLFAVPFVALIALGGVAAGVLALTKAPPSNHWLTAQVTADQSALHAATAQLQGDRTAIAHLSREVATLRRAGGRAASASDVTALQGSVSNIDTILNRYALCFPQMMRYVNGIQPTGSWVQDHKGDRLLTYPVSVSSDVQISSQCSWLLYGPPTG